MSLVGPDKLWSEDLTVALVESVFFGSRVSGSQDNFNSRMLNGPVSAEHIFLLICHNSLHRGVSLAKITKYQSLGQYILKAALSVLSCTRLDTNENGCTG